LKNSNKKQERESAAGSQDGSESDAVNSGPALPDRLRALPAKDRPQALLREIGLMMQQILGTKSAPVLTPESKLFEVGLKSIDLVELRGRLEKACDEKFQVSLFFAYSNLGSLSRHILEKILGLHSAESPPTSGNSDNLPLGAEEIRRLSEAEAEARLLQKIADLDGESGN
jgi:acyl carrier protein